MAAQYHYQLPALSSIPNNEAAYMLMLWLESGGSATEVKQTAGSFADFVLERNEIIKAIKNAAPSVTGNYQLAYNAAAASGSRWTVVQNTGGTLTETPLSITSTKGTITKSQSGTAQHTVDLDVDFTKLKSTAVGNLLTTDATGLVLLPSALPKNFDVQNIKEVDFTNGQTLAIADVSPATGGLYEPTLNGYQLVVFRDGSSSNTLASRGTFNYTEFGGTPESLVVFPGLMVYLLFSNGVLQKVEPLNNSQMLDRVLAGSETANTLVNTDTVTWTTGAPNLPLNRSLQPHVTIPALIDTTTGPNYAGQTVPLSQAVMSTANKIKVPLISFDNTQSIALTDTKNPTTLERVITANLLVQWQASVAVPQNTLRIDPLSNFLYSRSATAGTPKTTFAAELSAGMWDLIGAVDYTTVSGSHANLTAQVAATAAAQISQDTATGNVVIKDRKFTPITIDMSAKQDTEKFVKVGTASIRYIVTSGTPVISYTKTAGSGVGVMGVTGGTIRLKRFADTIAAADTNTDGMRFELVGTGTDMLFAIPSSVTRHTLVVADSASDASSASALANQLDIDNSPFVKYGNIVTTGQGSIILRTNHTSPDMGIDMVWA